MAGRLRATGVSVWRGRGLADATTMNRMAHLRRWAKAVGKPNVVKSNAGFGIGQRSHVCDGTKRRDFDPGKLARVKGEYVRTALRPQAAFRLRREEAIRFALARADRGDHIAVKASTAQGGRARDVAAWRAPGAAGESRCCRPRQDSHAYHTARFTSPASAGRVRGLGRPPPPVTVPWRCDRRRPPAASA